jgi:hypothetical protein
MITSGGVLAIAGAGATAAAIGVLAILVERTRPPRRRRRMGATPPDFTP